MVNWNNPHQKEEEEGFDPARQRTGKRTSPLRRLGEVFGSLLAIFLVSFLIYRVGLEGYPGLSTEKTDPDMPSLPASEEKKINDRPSDADGEQAKEDSLAPVPPSEPSSPESSSPENSNSSDETASSGKEGEGTPEESGQASLPQEEIDPIFSGYAQAGANTGDYIQSKQGTGKNHNTASSIYAYPIEEVQSAMYGDSDLDGEQKIAFLTIDDGICSTSGELLDILAKEGVPATFFIIGSSIHEENADILYRMMAEGHALGLHSFNHRYNELYPNRQADPKEIIRQFRESDQAYKAILGSDFQSRIWRYPGGHMSWNNISSGDEALAAEGVHWIDWNAINNDAEPNAPQTVQGQVDEVIKGWTAYGCPNAMVILMHDGEQKQLTREALPAIINELRNRGFSFGILE